MARKQTATEIAKWAERQVVTTPVPELIGRPTSLTRELADRVGRHIEQYCVKPLTAARACGIPERTWLRWTAIGREDDEHEKDSVYAYLWQVLDQKDAQLESDLLLEARTRLVGWQGPMTIASRRYDQWAEKQQVHQGIQIVLGNDSTINIALLSGGVQTASETVRPIVEGSRPSPLLTGEIHSVSDERV